MTTKLYDADSHLSTFTALVQECVESGAFYSVRLDQTAFFPEGGGQFADEGTLNGVQVVDVQIDDSGIITHICSGPLPVGEEVTGELNWPLRFRRMQSHSGEHIVSGMVHNLYGFDNIGFHLGNNDVTCDYNGILTEEDVHLIERKANEVVFANVPIFTGYPDPATLPTLEYRSKLDLTENVRLVTIPEVDVCACCAPHVTRTGEIGLIKIVHFEKSHGGTRLHLRCGWDALEDYEEKQENVLQIMDITSSPQAETAAAVSALSAKADGLAHDLSVANRGIAEAYLSGLSFTEGNLVVALENADSDTLMTLAKGGAASCSGMFVALSKTGEDTYRYIITTEAESGLNLSTLVKEINSALNGRGGGKPQLVQGSFQCPLLTIQAYFEKE